MTTIPTATAEKFHVTQEALDFWNNLDTDTQDDEVEKAEAEGYVGLSALAAAIYNAESNHASKASVIRQRDIEALALRTFKLLWTTDNVAVVNDELYHRDDLPAGMVKAFDKFYTA